MFEGCYVHRSKNIFKVCTVTLCMNGRYLSGSHPVRNKLNKKSISIF